MANGHGGKREGAGRKKKTEEQQIERVQSLTSAEESELIIEAELTKEQPEERIIIEPNKKSIDNMPESIENTLNHLLKQQRKEGIDPAEIEKLSHEVAYLRQEVEFIKKIIVVSVGGHQK